MRRLLCRFIQDDRGISAVEYVLLLAFIGAAVAVAASSIGEVVTGEVSDTADQMNGS